MLSNACLYPHQCQQHMSEYVSRLIFRLITPKFLSLARKRMLLLWSDAHGFIYILKAGIWDLYVYT